MRSGRSSVMAALTATLRSSVATYLSVPSNRLAVIGLSGLGIASGATVGAEGDLRKCEVLLLYGAMRHVAPETLEAALYRGENRYEAERRHVFTRSWLLAAHESQFTKPGDYVAVTAAGYPLILVKGEDGRVRGFHNVCRHRAGPLADDGEGACQGALVCRYHGWRYALDGRLANARDFGPAEGFDPRNYALFPLRCENWRGFVFVNMDRDTAPLSEAMAVFDGRLN